MLEIRKWLYKRNDDFLINLHRSWLSNSENLDEMDYFLAKFKSQILFKK